MTMTQGRECKRVIIIGWDGAGSYVTGTETPTLDAVFARGMGTLRTDAVLPTISAECWGSLYHGVLPEKHGRNNQLAASEPFPEPTAYPSLFRVAADQRPDARLASYCAWAPINNGLLERSVPCDRLSVPDEQLAEAAVQYIRQHPDVLLMTIILDLPDAGGHRHGYGTEGHLATIRETDRMTARLIRTLEEQGMLEDTLLIVTTDHGGGGISPTDHGGDLPADRDVFWVCAGPGITPGAQLPADFRWFDTAAVAAEALGLSIPEGWEARVPEGFWSR